MNHSFNIDIATQYGLAEAVIFEKIICWTGTTKYSKCFSGNFWVRKSIKDLQEDFPYLTEKSIIKALKKLEEKGLIVSGNFNDDKRDRTKWYALK